MATSTDMVTAGADGDGRYYEPDMVTHAALQEMQKCIEVAATYNYLGVPG